jgi:hypothetical protein
MSLSHRAKDFNIWQLAIYDIGRNIWQNLGGIAGWVVKNRRGINAVGASNLHKLASVDRAQPIPDCLPPSKT